MAPPLADNLRLLSYNHLFLTPRLVRLPARGDGVAGPRLPMLKVDSPNELLRARGDVDPKLWDPKLWRCTDSLFPLPPLETALYNRGLETGEKGVPTEGRRSERLAFAEDMGEPCLLAGLALREVERRYLGGVTNVVPGVAGWVAAGSRPSRDRCVGVRGMSERSSLARKRG